MKNLIKRVENKLNSQNYISLAKAKEEISSSASGFYWIYTKLPMKNFSETTPPLNSAHIDISKLAKIHDGLEAVITQKNSDYWCIYNGKGKQLKSRMSAGFTNTAGETGKLALLRCFQETDFRVKFIICEDKNILHGIHEHYHIIQKDIERLWRLNYGWPFLCRT